MCARLSRAPSSITGGLSLVFRSSPSLPLFVCLLFCLSCSERVGVRVSMDPGPVGGTADAGRDSGGPAIPEGAMPEAGPSELCSGGESHTYVINLLDFAREMPAGVCRGFDIDGRVSDADDEETCGKADYTSPEGVPGIDNQLQTLLPVVEGITEEDTALAIAEGIRSGGTLILIRVEHVDSFVDDDCVTFTGLWGLLPEGVMAPTVDAAGRLTPEQTFDVDARSYDERMYPLIRVDGAEIRAGTLVADGFAMTLPFSVGSTGTVPLTIRDARARLGVTPEGLAPGLLGGVVRVSELGPALSAAYPMLTPASITVLIGPSADLEIVGRRCGAISLALEFGGVSARLGVVRSP